ncbi:MAG: signal peptidase I [Caulobacter sp.]|jgi:signal peptidase I|nr:signal peptidase I [Caulobacter sp.]
MTDAADTTTETQAETPEPNGAVKETVEIVKTVVYALLIALVLRIFLFQPFTIPSASMEPNLLKGDYIIVSKFSYGYSRHSAPLSPPLFKGRILGSEPRRGDIIVFKFPRDDKIDYIKRLVGLPGDRIQVRGGLLYVNDKLASRVYDGVGDEGVCSDWMSNSQVQRFRETNIDGRTYETYDCGPRGALDDTEVFVVPAKHYFFMGDNRDNSDDSRANVGFVPAENLVGKAQIILLSWDGEAKLVQPWTWFTHARPSRFFKVLK